MSVPANDAATVPPIDVEFLTVQQAADLLAMKPDGLYPLLCQGKVPGAGKVGGAWRIHKPTLLRAFLSGSLVPAAQTAPRRLPRRRAR
jgi:hypothetical protein